MPAPARARAHAPAEEPYFAPTESHEFKTPPRRHLVAVPPLVRNDERIPDPPAALVRLLASRTYDIVQGGRGVAQLGANVTVGATRQLLAQRAVFTERRSVYRDTRGRVTGIGSIRLCRVQSEITEAAVVVHTDQGTHSVALRLEWFHGKWRACELYLI